MKGTLLERSPGVWRLRIYIGDDPATGGAIQVGRTFRGTKKYTPAALSEFVADVTHGVGPLCG
jgi:hypothetical protein